MVAGGELIRHEALYEQLAAAYAYEKLLTVFIPFPLYHLKFLVKGGSGSGVGAELWAIVVGGPGKPASGTLRSTTTAASPESGPHPCFPLNLESGDAVDDDVSSISVEHRPSSQVLIPSKYELNAAQQRDIVRIP